MGVCEYGAWIWRRVNDALKPISMGVLAAFKPI